MRLLPTLVLGTLSACAEPIDHNTQPDWAEDTAITGAPEANTRLYELEGSETAFADTEDQSMGCIGLETDNITSQLSLVVPTLVSSPAEYLFDREASLTSNGESIAGPVEASMEGELRFDMTATPASFEANSDNELCLVGNPGASTGTFQYQILTPDHFNTTADLGSDQTFPVKFTPFTVN